MKQIFHRFRIFTQNETNTAQMLKFYAKWNIFCADLENLRKTIHILHRFDFFLQNETDIAQIWKFYAKWNTYCTDLKILRKMKHILYRIGNFTQNETYIVQNWKIYEMKQILRGFGNFTQNDTNIARIWKFYDTGYVHAPASASAVSISTRPWIEAAVAVAGESTGSTCLRKWIKIHQNTLSITDWFQFLTAWTGSCRYGSIRVIECTA